MSDFEQKLFGKLDRIITLLESLAPEAAAIQPKPTNAPESYERDSRNKVSEEVYAKQGVEIVKRLFDDEAYTVHSMAEDLGTSPSTVSRILKRMEEEESFVRTVGGKIEYQPDNAIQWLEKKIGHLRPVQPLDDYTRRQGAKLIKALLRKDIRQFGRTTKTLAQEIGVQRTSAERLVRTLLEKLPYLEKASVGQPGSVVRVVPWQTTAAEAFVQQVEAEPAECAPNWTNADGISQETYITKAPEVVYALLDRTDGEFQPLQRISETTGIKPNMLRRILMKLHHEDNVPLAVPAVKDPHLGQRIRVLDSAAAYRWLETRTAPIAKESNGVPRVNRLDKLFQGGSV